jgi:hypothetical protein
MKRLFIHLFLLAGLVLTTSACKDDLEYGPLVRDNRPDVPVTFTNATTFGGTPYIEISTAGNTPITFNLSIPSGSGRTIKEIRVVGGTTGVNAASLNTASNLFQPTAIVGTGTTATFSTTLAAFRTRYPTVPVTPTGNPVSPREIGFIFAVTLDDGTQIVTVQTRVRVLA